MATTAPATPAPSKGFFAKLWGGIVKGEHAVVSAIEKVAGAVPEVEKLAAQYGPEVAALSNAVVAGSGKYTQVAVNAVTTIGQALQDGGQAAEQNFINQGFDTTLIADIKGLWGNLQKAAASAGSTPATIPGTPAPAAK